MSADVAVLVATAVLAVVALLAATVAVVAARRVARGPAPSVPGSVAPAPAAAPAAAVPHADDVPAVAVEVVESSVARDAAPDRTLEPRVVEGRVLVPPTQDQVVAAALGRPQARLSVVAQGVAHALRPESRDRIGALVRREYRSRRRARLRAGRRAARAAHASPTPPAAADQWLGER
jgi:hypothetical protein